MDKCTYCGETHDNLGEFCPNHPTLALEDESRRQARTADPLSGRLLAGRYRLLQKIGEGGMGAVYKAVHTKIDRICAIKLLTSANEPGVVTAERFNREARLASRIISPHAVLIYDFGEAEEGLLYLAMEYVDGCPLSGVLEEGPISVSRALTITRQIADVLTEAHRLGIIHRDLKPANIMITRKDSGSDFVKVLDFGIAKHILGESEHLTASGLIIGTPAYMSPEQVLGEDVDARSDVYSLAVLVYRMLGGQLPFQGSNPQTLLAKKLTGDPLPLRAVVPSIDASVERAVMSGLQRDLKARTATAEEFVSALELAGESGSKSDTIPQSRQERAGSGSSGSRTMADAGAQTPSSAPRVVSVQPAAHLEIPALAVLDFENIFRDSGMDWYGTGIAETITADLKKVKRFRVLGRERIYAVLKSANKHDDTDTDFSAIGRQLGVKWLVGGSYQKAADLIRITPSLLDVESGKVIATNKLDGKWEDVFVLQDRVVTDLLSFMEVKVSMPFSARAGSAQDKQLQAYEHYAQARKALYDFDKDSLEEARQHLEIAIELDSDYAVAHSLLGYTHAMRFIHTGDPSEFARALPLLERAISLDAELGEPYPYLCYIYGRSGQIQEAIEAGLKGVDLQPDLVQAHYFLGATLTFSIETSPENYQRAVDSLLNAVRIGPRWEASWEVLGWLALMAGHYEEAEHFLVQALDLSNTGTSFGKFIGAETLLGSLWLRELDWGKSKQFYSLALESAAKSEHMYREVFIALSACGLGDVHLRLSLAEPALANFHQAWRIAKEFPRMIGQRRILARTLAGMAAAYAINGDKGRAEQLASDAKEVLEPLLSEPQSFVLDAGVAQIAYALAVTRLHLGDPAGALDLLERAVDKGWRDPKWLQSDPELEPVRKEAKFLALLGRISAMPSLRFS
jgi:serine/threonine protein kinase/tetratricopeptide (TPR) repeat protein